MTFRSSRITPQHHPWCGYWHKAYTPYSPPPPASEGWLFVGGDNHILQLDALTLDIETVYIDRGANSLCSGNGNNFYGTFSNKIQRYNAGTSEIILMNESASVSASWTANRRLCFDETNVYALGQGGGIRRGVKASGADASILANVSYSDPSSFSSGQITGSHLYWNQDRTVSYTIATNNGINYLYEFDGSMAITGKIVAPTSVVGTDSNNYVSKNRLGPTYEPISNVGWPNAWVLCDPDVTAIDPEAWIALTEALIATQVSWSAIDGEYAIGISEALVKQWHSVDPVTGTLSSAHGAYDPTYSIVVGTDGFVYTNDSGHIRRFTFDGAFTGAIFDIPTTGAVPTFCHEMYELLGWLYTYARYDAGGQLFVYRLKMSDLSLQATSVNTSPFILNPQCICGLTY